MQRTVVPNLKLLCPQDMKPSQHITHQEAPLSLESRIFYWVFIMYTQVIKLLAGGLNLISNL